MELAGALGEIAHDTLRRDFRSIRPNETRIVLVEAMDRVLPPYPPDRSDSAQRQLERLGVEVRTRMRVIGLDADGVVVTGPDGTEERIAAKTVFWAAGVLGARFGRTRRRGDGAPTDRAGRVLVEPDLTDPGPSGDLRRRRRRGPAVEAREADAGRRPGGHPGWRVRGARSSVAGSSAGRTSRSATATTAMWQSSGASAGVTNISWLGPFGRQGGFTAWALWLGIHIFYLIGFSNRIVVLVRWAWTFLTHGRGTRLITGSVLLPPIEEPEPPVVRRPGTRRHVVDGRGGRQSLNEQPNAGDRRSPAFDERAEVSGRVPSVRSPGRVH